MRTNNGHDAIKRQLGQGRIQHASHDNMAGIQMALDEKSPKHTHVGNQSCPSNHEHAPDMGKGEKGDVDSGGVNRNDKHEIPEQQINQPNTNERG